MDNQKVFDKSRFKEDGIRFVGIPQAFEHYIHHPKFQPEMAYLYALIVDYYNVEKGFAYPSLLTLEMRYKRNRATVSKHLKTLKEIGLLDYMEDHKGNIAEPSYIPLVPLEAAEFYEEFPEAWAAYQTAFKKRASQQDASRERIRLWREKKYAE